MSDALYMLRPNEQAYSDNKVSSSSFGQLLLMVFVCNMLFISYAGLRFVGGQTDWLFWLLVVGVINQFVGLSWAFVSYMMSNTGVEVVDTHSRPAGVERDFKPRPAA